MSPQRTAERGAWLWGSVLLVALVLAVFGAAIQFGFLAYDDDAHVWADQYIYPLSAQKLAYFWRYPFDKSPVPGLPGDYNGIAWPHQLIYTPVSFTVLALLAKFAAGSGPLYQANSLQSWPFHSLNILLHALNAVLLFALLRRWCSTPAAWLGAALFAIHPLQVEPVVWVTGLNNELSLAWGLGALLLYLPRGETKFGPRYVASGLCFAIALLCKPSVSVLAPIALLLEWRFNGGSWRSALARVAPWLVLAVLCVLVNSRLRTSNDVAQAVAWPLRPFVVGDALTFYTAKVLLPYPLVVDYGRKPQWVMENWWGYLTGLPTLALLAFLSWQALRKRTPGWTGLWTAYLCFLLALVPTSGLVPYYFQSVSTVADRYVYVGFIGIGLAVALGWETLERRMPVVRPRQIAAGAVLLTAGALAFFQVLTWRNDVTLWQNTLRHSPRSWLARLALADDAGTRGDWPRAVELLSEARRYYPTDWLIELRLADALRAAGRKTEALESYKRAIQRYTGEPRARLHYGQLLEESGDFSAAAQQYYMGTEIQPSNGELLGSLGTVLVKLGQYERAQSYLSQALEHGYSAYRYHLALGIAAGRQGNLPAAAEELRSALREDPNGWEAHFNLGQALVMLRQPGEARQHLSAAHQLQPQSAKILEALARVERDQGNAAQAAEHERQARALAAKSP